MQETTICNKCMSTAILHFYYDTNRFEGICPNCGRTVNENGGKAKEVIDKEYLKCYRECEEENNQWRRMEWKR